jgi:hypothetical protein
MIDFLSWICDLVFAAIAWFFPGICDDAGI